jgi:hypothetical protein
VIVADKDDDEAKGKSSDDAAAKGGDDKSKKPAPWAAEFGEELDPDRAWRTILNQRDSEKELSGKVQTMQEQLDAALAEVAAFKDAGKTPDEQLAGKVTALETAVNTLERANADLRVTNTETEIRYQIMLEAQKLEHGDAKQRFRDPAVVLKLIDRASLKLNKDNLPEEGEVARALADLAKSHPYLLESTGGLDTDGDKTRPKVPATRKGDDGKELAKEEIDRRRKESRVKMARLWR